MDSQGENVEPSSQSIENSSERTPLALEPEVAELLRFELNSALLQFVQAERPVVLEGLGIVSPERKKLHRTHFMGSWGVVREETLQTLAFEKCQDTSCLPQASYSRLVDTRELVQSIYSRLPLAFQLRWSERELRRLLVQFIREVRNEVTENGFSDQLRGLGHLYAIHNRQGSSIADWFAGADMFMVPRQLRPLSLGSAHRFARPILENAWELWEATSGSAVWSGTLSLRNSLLELGFPEDVIEEQAIAPDELRVAMFLPDPPSSAGKSAGTSERFAVFVTDGLRTAFRSDSASSKTKHKLRHELVLRVPAGVLQHAAASAAPQASLARERDNQFTPPVWVGHLLAAGALLLASDRVNPLRANAALSLGRTLTGTNDCKLRSVFLVPCAQFGSQQLSADGPFHYATVLGIARDEAALLASYGREHLLAILESRGFSQATVPARSSTLLRSHVTPVRSRQPGQRQGDVPTANGLTKSFSTTQLVPM